MGNVYKNCCIGVYFGEERILCRKRPVMVSGGMEEIRLEKEKLLSRPDLKTITIRAEEESRMETRERICIGCPLTVTMEGKDVVAVAGNTCKRGFECVRALKNVTVKVPVHIGDVIPENVAGTGADVVATKNASVKNV